MKRNGFLDVRWGWAVAGVLAAEATLVAAAFAWVAIYSYLLNPGQQAADYQRYAMSASPYVCLLLGVPVFLAICRWIGRRRPSSAVATAMGLFGLYCLIEVPLMLAG